MQTQHRNERNMKHVPLGGTGSLQTYATWARLQLVTLIEALPLLARKLHPVDAKIADLPFVQEVGDLALKVLASRYLDPPGLNGNSLRVWARLRRVFFVGTCMMLECWTRQVP